MLLKMTRGLSLLTFAFILIFPCATPAKVINGDAALITELTRSFIDGSKTIDKIKKDLNTAKDEYQKNSSSQLIWGDPAEITQVGNFFAISFYATVSSPDPTAAIFTLLYEKDNFNELEYSKNYLSWIGTNEIKGFKNISVNALCGLFENQTGKSICLPEGEMAKANQSLVLASEMEAEIGDLEARLQQQISQATVPPHAHNAGDIMEGTLQASLIDDTICRDEELAQAVSKLSQEINKRPIPDTVADNGIDATVQQELMDKIAEVEALKTQISDLQETVSHLATILAGVTRDGTDLVFSGMNLYVVNGAGTTDGTPNGLGNLIVGYNESSNQNKINSNGGSHNLVIGINQTYTSYGGLIAGSSNRISAPYATITGGFNNLSGGNYSTISGGQLNTASGDYSTVSGGLARKAEGNNNWSAGDQTSVK